MPRARPEDRFDDLVDAAARAFCERGYRRTQMADVAREMGVAPGTLYNYVEGKEALFDLCVQRAFLVVEPPPRPDLLPVPTPDPQAVLGHVRERLARGRRIPGLREASRRDDVDDPAKELACLVRAHFLWLLDNRRGMQLIERSAIDRPDLAEVYFGRGRRGLIGVWQRYIERRIAGGFFRPVPDSEVAARFVIETCAWWAWHRHGDPHPQHYDGDGVLDTVTTLVVRALVKETQP